MKFKVGDKVKILRKDDTFGWDHDMARDIGYTFLLDEPYGNAGWCINEYMWSEDALELVSEVGECVKNIRQEIIPQNVESFPEKKEEVKEEHRYTMQEIKEAWDNSCDGWDDFKNELMKINNPEYNEYLRLRAIYEG